MNLRDFRQAGHWPTLCCAFLYFDVSFMVWMLMGALANSIALQVEGISAAQKGLLVATPVLGGAALRLVLGVLADQHGGRRIGLVGLALTAIPLLLGWLWADSLPSLLAVGLLLGVAGASFAVAMPLASRWYPPRFQGLALGIAGAGNSGTVLAMLFAPRLAEAFGWQAVFGLALIPVALTFGVFALFAKDSPSQPPPRPLSDYHRVLGRGDTWWCCLFYGVTFGGFVGLASFLNVFFRDQYDLSAIGAGNFAAACVTAGSLLRPLGGYVADRIGGARLLQALYVGFGMAMFGMAFLPAEGFALILLFIATGLLGLGNGAVFQLVPQRFPYDVGVVTGIVGAAGGVGGFFLPTLLGGIKELSGSFTGGFLILAIVGAGAAAAVAVVSRSWGSGLVVHELRRIDERSKQQHQATYRLTDEQVIRTPTMDCKLGPGVPARK